MNKLVRDPQIDELVRELNQSSAAPQAEPQPPDRPQTQESDPLEALLIEINRRGASDLLLLAGSPPIFRIDGRLSAGDRSPLSHDEIHRLLSAALGGTLRERLNRDGAADFSLRLSRPSGEEERRALRFRVNAHRQRGTLAASIRALPPEIPTLSELGLPASLAELTRPAQGLVLICGPTGAGKSTTLAALIGEINRRDTRHIITIEDPIEYEHRNSMSVIEQIEVGRDSPAFAQALRAALRQDPDVILVGEMRDFETAATALTAAETGHLIFSTLHTSDVGQALHRIVDLFPASQQHQIRQQLALTLHAVVVQHLIPRAGASGRAVAVEVLLANMAVRNHIRNDKMQNLANEITLGKRQGMIALEDSLAGLVQKGTISRDDARARSSRPDELESLLRGR